VSLVPNLFLSNLQVPGYIQDPFVEATHVFSSGTLKYSDISST